FQVTADTPVFGVTSPATSSMSSVHRTAIMIRKRTLAYLRERLPTKTWDTRLVRQDGRCFMEFNATDVDRLARLGIEVNHLGPQLVVCLWDEGSPLEVGGYLVVDNLAMGRPSLGGIRLLP